MKKFGVAIIGCGAIHKVHIDAIRKNPNAQLIAVVDIDRDKAAAKAEEYDCRFYTDYHEMLKDNAIDVVHICTPHYLHASMAINAMKSGKHVLVEKPMAIKPSDAEEMISVSRQTGKKLGVCFQNRYNVSSLRVKKLLSSGKAGRIKGARAFVTWNRDENYYKNGSWRGTWEQEGGGVLINQAIHTLDLLQWFLGDIEEMKGNADTRLLEGIIEVEDTAETTIRFKNGAVGLFYATNNYCTDSPIQIEVICEKALINISDELTVTYSNGEKEHIGKSDKIPSIKSYWGCGHTALVNHFYECLEKGEEPFINGIQGITAIKMIEAIYKSSKTGEFIIL